VRGPLCSNLANRFEAFRVQRTHGLYHQRRRKWNRIEDKGGLSFTARFDEKPYPTSINPAGNTVTLKRIDDRTLRAVYRLKDGTAYRTSTLAVSGGTLTETSDVADPAGTPFQSVLVFRSQ
jgi:hypothetical protein